MITDILISAGGKGTRMKELTAHMPKHLIEVEGRPFLRHLLDHVLEAGFKHIYLVVGYKKESIEKFVTEHAYPITLIDQFSLLHDKYGTACPVMCAEAYLQGKQFVSVAGDNFYSVEDLHAIAEHDDEYSYIGGFTHQTPEQFGVLVTSPDGLLERIVEKPSVPVGRLINTSLYKFTPDIFEAISHVGASPRGEFEITDAISLLAQKKRVRVEPLRGVWMDFGKPEDIQTMECLLREVRSHATMNV